MRMINVGAGDKPREWHEKRIAVLRDTALRFTGPTPLLDGAIAWHEAALEAANDARP